MNQTIHTIPQELLEAYLNDLKAEAEKVAHIVKYLNDSMIVRAELAAKLESGLRGNLAEDDPVATVSLTKEVA